MGICLRYSRTTAEAQDIFQDAFVKVFDQIHTLKNPESLDQWIRSIVIRTAIDYYHHSIRERQLTDLEYVEQADTFDILDQLSMQEIVDVIQQLPDGCRMVVNLYLIDGYEHSEIGALLGISTGTSKSQLFRGKKLLRDVLRQKGLIRHG
jgi:RNA polymerase sigma factor (sigma-70 family)